MPTEKAWIALLVVALGCGRGAPRADRRDAATAPAPARPVPAGALPASVIAVSRDGKRIATVEGDVALRVRDTADLAVIATVSLCLAGAPAAPGIAPCPADRRPAVSGLAFSPDGAAVAVACTGCAPGSSVHVVEVATGALRFAHAATEAPRAVAWGEALAVAFDDAVEILDPATGAPRRTAGGSLPRLASDGSAFVTGTEIVSLVDGARHDARWFATIPLPAQRGFLHVDDGSIQRYPLAGSFDAYVIQDAGADGAVTSADGRFVLAFDRSSSDGPVMRLIDVDREALLLEAPLTVGAEALAVGPGGEVWVAGAAGPARLERQAVPWGLTVSRSGAHLLSIEALDNARVARVRDTSAAMAPVGPPVALTGDARGAFSPDERRVAIGDGAALVLIAVDGKTAERRIALPFDAGDVAWGDAGVIVAGPGRLASIDPDTGTVTPIAISGALESLAPDGSAYCLRDQQPPYEVGQPGGGRGWVVPPARLECVALAGGAHHVMATDTQAQLRALDGGAAVLVDSTSVELHDASGDRRARITHPFDDVPLVATSRDGRWVAQVGGSYDVIRYDTRAQAIVARDSPPQTPTALAIAGDGTVFVGQQGGGLLRLPPP